MKKNGYFLLFCVAILIFVYTSTLLTTRVIESASQKNLSESINSFVYSKSDDPIQLTEIDEEFYSSERIQRQNQLFDLYEMNDDLIGWLQIDGLVIDYPVVQNFIEPDFYLTKDFNQKKSSFGTIYMDANCHFGYSKNYILYGHHMKNGTMFAALNNYDNKVFFNEHPIIQLDTLSELSDYQIIGAFKVSSSDIEKVQDFILFSTKEDFMLFKDYFETHKFYDTEINYSYDDQFLTLMTCEYTYKNGRFFVIAKKVN